MVSKQDLCLPTSAPRFWADKVASDPYLSLSILTKWIILIWTLWVLFFVWYRLRRPWKKCSKKSYILIGGGGQFMTSFLQGGLSCCDKVWQRGRGVLKCTILHDVIYEWPLGWSRQKSFSIFHTFNKRFIAAILVLC